VTLLAVLGNAAVVVLVAFGLVVVARAERLHPRERVLGVTPCSGWVARYSDGRDDRVGTRRRPVAAWALLDGPRGRRVVGLTTDWERVPDYSRGTPGCTWHPDKLARPPAAALVRCDLREGFTGYSADGDR
jgi:hypothetical protein